MYDNIGPTRDSNAKLTIRKEISDNCITKDAHNKRYKATKTCAKFKRTDACEVIRIFMEGYKILSRGGIMNRKRKLVVKDRWRRSVKAEK